MLPGPESFVLVMGVSGSGKSSFSNQLAKAIGAEFIDADDVHSEQAKRQMARGVPLTDEQRLPWIKRLCGIVTQRYRLNQPFVLACSLLRAEHRALLYKTNLPFALIYLHGDKDLIRLRLENRAEHFFSASLLDDQFVMLQPPDETEPALSLDVSLSLDAMVDKAVEYLNGLKK